MPESISVNRITAVNVEPPAREGCSLFEFFRSGEMRAFRLLFGAFIIDALALPAATQNHRDSELSPKLLEAKSAYFEDRTGAAHVREKAPEQLQKEVGKTDEVSGANAPLSE